MFNIVSKLKFWWDTRNTKENVDFLVDIDELGILITVIKGKYIGVMFRYANMVFTESGELSFNTVVVMNENGINPQEKDFEKLASNILRVLLSESVEDLKAQEDFDYSDDKYLPQDIDMETIDNEQVNNENRDTDTFEPIEERAFYEEESPLLEKRVSVRKSGKKAIRPNKRVRSKVQQDSKPKRTSSRTTGKKRPK